MRIPGLFLLLLTSCPLQAQENYVTNPATLYPPGCATLTAFENENAQGASQLFLTTDIRLLDPTDGNRSNVRVSIFRQGCAEPNRAIIKLELRVTSGGGALVPFVQAFLDNQAYILRLTTDPNTYSEFSTGSLIFQGEPHTFFLDGPTWPDLQAIIDQGLPILTPEQYNGAFELDFVDVLDFVPWTVPIAAYENDLQSTMMPFNGRLSGNWVVAGVPDQGFVIAFEELPDGTNFVFLSWYTYDADGNLLWLTAGDTYEIGDSEIELQIELVTNGEFLGPAAAERSVVGTATLKAIHCNNLQLTYDLTALGLGSGTVTLQRLFSLETAGYACRDQIERADTIED